jgi:hypothetical protein
MLYRCDQTNEYGLSILDGMLYVIWCDQTNEYGLSILENIERPHSLVWSLPYNIPSNIERPYSLVWSHPYNIPTNIERPHSLVSLYIWWYVICYMGVTRPMSVVSLYWIVCYMLYGCDQTNEYGLSILDGMLYVIWVWPDQWVWSLYRVAPR